MTRGKTSAQGSAGSVGLASQQTGGRLLSTSTTPKKQKSAVREYAEALLFALVLALFIRSFIVQAFKIPSGSMLPTLQIGDHILVSKFAYGLRLPYPLETLVFEWARPEPGDIVVFVYPKDGTKDFIKRVVAVAGDEVRIRNKKLFVNGIADESPYAHFANPDRIIPGPRDNYPPVLPDRSNESVVVPSGKLFVMGDNRDHSHDSRFWGFVDTQDVKGKAFLIYWSWDGQDRWVRWERLGALIY